MPVEFKMPKEYKWQELSTKLDNIKFIQAFTEAETTSFTAQTPPKSGIAILGVGAADALEVYISQYDPATSGIVWTQLV